MPKVSVIIPVYNTEHYLRECLDSIVNQTLKDIEIICVNDGSTDNSFVILENYAKKDIRVKILTQENKGAGAARNAGLNIAQGNYLAFLDSDDIYELTMLEKMYIRLEQTQADFVICRSRAFDNQNVQKTWDIGWSALKIYKDVFSYKDTLNDDHGFDFLIGWPWDKLFRKSFIDKYGLRFQEISHSNDGFFVNSAMYAAEKITILHEFLVKHRLNRECSIEVTHHKNPLCFYEMINAVRKCLNDLDVLPEIYERFALWALRHSLWVLRIIKTHKAFTKIYTAFKSYIFSEIGINDLPSNRFPCQEYYTEREKIMSLSHGEYLFEQCKRLHFEMDNVRQELDGARQELGNTRHELDGTRQELGSARQELGGTRQELGSARQELDGIRQELGSTQQELYSIRSSFSYRCGRKLTWFPRKAHGFFRCLKMNGLRYTAKHFVKKCLGK